MSNLIEIENAENDVLACAALVAERIRSAEGHAASVSTVALRYAAKGELDLAAQLADSISDPHIRDTVLTEIAVRCVDFNDDEYGVQLAEAIDDYGFQQQALHLLAVRQAERGRFDEAVQTAERIDDPVATRGEIAIRLADAGDEARATNTLEKIDLTEVRVHALNQIASARSRRGESPAEILNSSLAEIENIELPEEQTHQSIEVAARFLNAGETEAAFAVLEKAKHAAESLEPRFRDQALSEIAVQYARAEEFERAENTLKPIENLHQAASAQNAISQIHLSRDDKEAALASVEEAYAVLRSQPERQVRDSKARYFLFASIAVNFAQFGKPEKALEIALENPDEEPRNQALVNIAAICQAEGNWELARQTVISIPATATRISALASMSNAEWHKGNAVIAAELMTEAQSLIEDVDRIDLQSRLLDEIAEQFAARDDKAKAAELLRESLLLIQTFADQNNQSQGLAEVASIYDQASIEPTEAERDILKAIVRKRLTTG